MPAMIATDPEKDNPALVCFFSSSKHNPPNVQAKSIIRSCVKACMHMPSVEKIDRIEMPLSRLLLVLAHHPDLEEWSLLITKDMAK